MRAADTLQSMAVAIWTDERFRGGRGDAIALAAARLAKTQDLFGGCEPEQRQQDADHPDQTYLELPI